MKKWIMADENNRHADIDINGAGIQIYRDSKYTGDMIFSRDEMLSLRRKVFAVNDMYEALEMVSNWTIGDSPEKGRETMEAIKAALAKARGEK